MAQKRQRLLIVTGPESSGKTTLAKALAQRLGVPLIAEMAREYLESRRPADTAYGPADLRRIAQLQQIAEDAALASGAGVVVADTDQQVIELWWHEKYGSGFEYPPRSAHSSDAQRYYLLCYPDLEWQPDPLRENPLDRPRLFRLHLQKLEAVRADYRVIWGLGEFRQRLARQYVDTLLAQ